MGQDNQFQIPITKSFTAVSQTSDLTSPNSGTSIIQVIGTWVGTLILEGSNDNSNWVSLNLLNNSTKLLVSSITTNGVYIGETNGFQFLRLNSSLWTSGTADTYVHGSDVASLLTTDSLLRGATDGTLIGNINDRLKNASTLYSSNGLEAGTSSNAIRIDPTGTTTQPVNTLQLATTLGQKTMANSASVVIASDQTDPTYALLNTTLPTQSQLVSGSDGTNSIPLAVDSTGRLITSAITGYGADFTFGDTTTSALTRVLVCRTSVTEQTTNGQRSIASANANDTAAGTGARTVKITYLDQTGAGPFTETLTLNGTTGVNTVATNICYLEHIEVLTAGSTGSNAGIITLYSAINKGGVSVWTVTATANQTICAIHYVPSGTICNITGISCGHNGTTVGSGALFTINVKYITLTDAVESQVSDFVRLYGQSSTFSRVYSSPIKITGPARLQVYVTPETTSSTIYRAAFDYFEP